MLLDSGARSRGHSLAVARLLALLLLLAAVPARATDLVVPDDVATVQAGLDAAMPSDTVSVRDTPGPWFARCAPGRSRPASSAT